LWTLLITASDIKIQPSPIQSIQKRRPSSEGYGEGGEVDAAPGLHGLDAERHGEMRFAGAG
jgi:hypothetical protein